MCDWREISVVPFLFLYRESIDAVGCVKPRARHGAIFSYRDTGLFNGAVTICRQSVPAVCLLFPRKLICLLFWEYLIGRSCLYMPLFETPVAALSRPAPTNTKSACNSPCISQLSSPAVLPSLPLLGCSRVLGRRQIGHLSTDRALVIQGSLGLRALGAEVCHDFVYLEWGCAGESIFSNSFVLKLTEPILWDE